MKIIYLFILSCFFTACSKHIFHYANYQPAASSRIDTFELNADNYDLYIKLICTKADSIYKSIPCNCDEKSDTIVEEEFMFIEKEPDPKKRHIIVINKIPNRNQKFYEEGAPQSNIKGLRDNDTAFVNIWYFNQFRYGVFYDQSSASFITIDAKSQIELWKIDQQEGAVAVTEILGKYPKGYSFVSTDSALALLPVFVKKPVFEIILQSFEKDAARFTLSSKTIYVEDIKRRKKITFINFGTPLDGKNSSVYFKSNRVYAYPLLQNTISKEPAGMGKVNGEK